MVTKNNLTALTGLRSLACLWVIVFHMAQHGGWLHDAVDACPTPVSNLVRCGYLGVSLFFVLSGFILTHTYSPQLAPRQFWWNRFARIYPVYLLSLLVLIPLFYPGLARWGVVKFGLVAGLVQSWHPKFATFWNAAAWSLSAEAFFYGVFPVILPSFFRIGRPKLIIGLAYTAALLSIAATVLLFPSLRGFNAVESPSGLVIDFVRFNPLMRLPEFIVGIGFALVYKRGIRQVSWIWPSLFILVGVGLFARSVNYALMTMALAPVFGWLILCLASRGCKGLEHAWAVKAGEASYAAYLLHIPVSLYILLVLPGPGLLPFLAYLAAVAGVSLLVFTHIEEPMRRWIRGRFHEPLK